jgi:hypothetical protein
MDYEGKKERLLRGFVEFCQIRLIVRPNVLFGHIKVTGICSTTLEYPQTIKSWGIIFLKGRAIEVLIDMHFCRFIETTKNKAFY